MTFGRFRLLPEALLSAPVFLVTLLWVIVVQLGEWAALGGPADDIPLRLVALVAVQVLFFAFPYVTWRAICPHVRARSWNGLLLVSIIVGAVVRGVALGILLVSAGVTQSLELGFRIAASLSHMAVVVVLLWFLVSEVRELQSRRRRLIADRDQLLALEAAARRDLTNLGDRATEEIKQSILDSLAGLRSTDSIGLRERLRVTIDDVVRPLSQQLAAQPSAWAPPQPPIETVGINWPLALREGLEPRRIRPVIIPVLLVWIGLPIHLFQYGPAPTAGFVATLIIVIPAFWLARKIAVRLTAASGEAATAAAFVIAVMAGGLALGTAMLPYMRYEPLPFLFVLVAPFLALLVAGPLAIAQAARDQDLELDSALEATTADLRWTLARTREEYRQHEGALARAVHGHLQASLAAAFMRLDRAVALGADDDALRETVRTEVLAAVTGLDVTMSDPEPVDQVMKKTQSTWSGAVSLAFSGDQQVIDALSHDPLCARTVNDLIPELVFNSVRHGQARSIEVLLEIPDTRTLSLTVIDDGSADLITTRYGLGSAILDEASITWTRTRIDTCTTTACLLPLFIPSSALVTP
jgi:hypothetical protein